MARGKFHNGNMGPTDSVLVMYEKGDFFTDERLAKKKTTDAQAAERAAAKSRPSVYTKYVFISDCSNGRQSSFKTVCKVDADLSKHSFDEVRAEASRLLNNSGRSCGGLKYLGPDNDVHIDGQAGRDYAITGGMMMD